MVSNVLKSKTMYQNAIEHLMCKFCCKYFQILYTFFKTCANGRLHPATPLPPLFAWRGKLIRRNADIIFYVVFISP